MKQQRRPRRSASEWRELIDRQGASVQSKRGFCETTGLSISTFTYWKRKLVSAPVANRRVDVHAPLFTPIQALPDSAETSAEGESVRSNWSIDLDDGLRLSIHKVA